MCSRCANGSFIGIKRSLAIFLPIIFDTTNVPMATQYSPRALFFFSKQQSTDTTNSARSNAGSTGGTPQSAKNRARTQKQTNRIAQLDVVFQWCFVQRQNRHSENYLLTSLMAAQTMAKARWNILETAAAYPELSGTRHTTDGSESVCRVLFCQIARSWNVAGGDQNELHVLAKFVNYIAKELACSLNRCCRHCSERRWGCVLCLLSCRCLFYRTTQWRDRLCVDLWPNTNSWRWILPKESLQVRTIGGHDWSCRERMLTFGGDRTVLRICTSICCSIIVIPMLVIYIVLDMFRYLDRFK